MKILFIKSTIHHKNLRFILNCKQIHFYIINNVNEIKNINLSDYDAVYSPCDIIDVSIYPNTKFVFGPHCCLFPNEQNLDLVKGKKSIYIQPSYWPINFWHCCDIKTKELNLIPFAFGVDTEKFKNIKPINEKNKVFVYYKNRNPRDLHIIEYFLRQKSIEYRIFSYSNRYDENDYIQYLQDSKFGIWVGAHESQGFGLEEALSTNTPLLVWNIKSMNQEYMSRYDDIPATSIPYWDQRCGEYFYNIEELEETFNLFTSKLNTYKPREYILEKLSVEVCESNFIKLIESI